MKVVGQRRVVVNVIESTPSGFNWIAAFQRQGIGMIPVDRARQNVITLGMTIGFAFVGRLLVSRRSMCWYQQWSPSWVAGRFLTKPFIGIVGLASISVDSMGCSGLFAGGP